MPCGPFELTLRDWARRDPAVRNVVREVDDARVELATKLYLELGLSLSEARDYAHAHMAYVIGDRMSKSGDDAHELQRRRSNSPNARTTTCAMEYAPRYWLDVRAHPSLQDTHFSSRSTHAPDLNSRAGQTGSRDDRVLKLQRNFNYMRV